MACAPTQAHRSIPGFNGLQPPGDGSRQVRFRAHIDHLKPQSVCRQELVSRGLEPGRTLGEDMDHRNMVAALLVQGAQRELFGAAFRGNQTLPVWPTQEACESRFRFGRDGDIEGLDANAKLTVDVLRLNHGTLSGWRQAALDVFLAPEVVSSRNEIESLIVRLDQPQDGRLAEYCFCIKSVAMALIAPPR